MQAAVGDRIVVPSHKVGVPRREGKVIGVGTGGGPPYRVRWNDSGKEGLFFPGPDAFVEHTDGSQLDPDGD